MLALRGLQGRSLGRLSPSMGRKCSIKISGAIIRIPVGRGSRIPRQDRHLKEVAFDYTFRVGTSRMKDWGLYQWLQHDDGWNFLEFLTYLQEFLDQHFRELSPIWTVNVETRAMMTLDRMHWRKLSYAGSANDGRESEMQDRVRDQVEIFREQSANVHDWVLRIRCLLMQGIEDRDYLDLYIIVPTLVATYADWRNDGRPHMLDDERSLKTFWLIIAGYLFYVVFFFGVPVMVRQTEVRGCDDRGFDGTRIETAVS